MKKTEKPKEGTPLSPQTTDLSKHGEIKTDYPLSEKDEIKQAEEKMRKSANKDK